MYMLLIEYNQAYWKGEWGYFPGPEDFSGTQIQKNTFIILEAKAFFFFFLINSTILGSIILGFQSNII